MVPEDLQGVESVSCQRPSNDSVKTRQDETVGEHPAEP